MLSEQKAEAVVERERKQKSLGAQYVSDYRWETSTCVFQRSAGWHGGEDDEFADNGRTVSGAHVNTYHVGDANDKIVER